MIGIKWVMERYVVAVDKPSGILDAPNHYRKEKYIFNLLFSVIALNAKTKNLLDSLPEYREI